MTPRPPKKRDPKACTAIRVHRSARPGKIPSESTPQIVAIEKPIYGGAFLARIEGKAVFVPLALPGEQTSVRIAEEKRGYATAEADEIITRAPERAQPACPYFGSCGGCQYQHADYAAQLRFKQAILRETLERAGVPVPGEIEMLAADPWTYRNRIRLAFDLHGNPGYRGRRSHQVIPIAQCPISASVLVSAAIEFAQLARTLAPSFRPSEIALFCNHDESRLLLSVFVAQPIKLPIDKIACSLKERITALAGMELITEGRPDQPQRTLAQWGITSLTYRVANFDYRVDNGAFFQVNRWLVDNLTARVTANHTGILAWDIFAGVGLFARQLTASFDHVVAVESAFTSTAALAHNLAGTSASSFASSTLDFLRRNRNGNRPDLIVVDPPRTGLGPETTALLSEIAAPRLTYVSCDPATLARDLRALIAGGYSIQRLTLADLFPQTFHLETIVDLRHA